MNFLHPKMFFLQALLAAVAASVILYWIKDFSIALPLILLLLVGLGVQAYRFLTTKEETNSNKRKLNTALVLHAFVSPLILRTILVAVENREWRLTLIILLALALIIHLIILLRQQQRDSRTVS